MYDPRGSDLLEDGHHVGVIGGEAVVELTGGVEAAGEAVGADSDGVSGVARLDLVAIQRNLQNFPRTTVNYC